MKINELQGKQLTSLLTELFGLKGAKEVFARHNVEMITIEVEKQGLKQFIEEAKRLFETSKVVIEYKQATQFLDAQLKTNKSMLETAEGFMKTIIEGMVKGFETSKQVAVQSQSPLFREELKGILENIVNEEDKQQVEKLISEMTLDNFESFIGIVSSVELAINERYRTDVKEEIHEEVSEAKEVQVKEEKPAAKKATKKETPKKVVVEADKLEEGLADFDLSDLDDEPVEEKKVEEKPVKKEEPKKKEVSDEGFDLDDLDEFMDDDPDFDFGDEVAEEKPKPVEVKPVVKEEKAKKDDFDLEDEEFDFGDLDDLADDVDPFN